MTEIKQEIRKKLIAERLAVAPETARNFAVSIIPKLLGLIPSGAVVAVYAPMRGEIDVMPALRELAARGHRVCLPVIKDGKTLEFREFSPDSTLIAGKFGALCPPENAEVLTPDVLIVPLVGFDAAGNRLGYGGGYYDVTISALRAQNKLLKTIGVAYSFQRVENLPTEAHDEKLDVVVTE